MDYILFFLILVSLFSMLILSNKRWGLALILIILMILLVKNPDVSINSAKSGLELFLFTVMPALLPFFIINDMLIAIRVPDNISKLFAPITSFAFNTSGYGAYVFIMSIFSGYPTGVKITADLTKNNDITTQEAQKILAFSSTSGPLFIIGVVGTVMLKSTYAGYILFSIHIAGALLNGLLYNNLLTPKIKTVNNNKHIAYTKGLSTSAIIAEAITNSLKACGIIGGYVILFSVLLSLLDKINFFIILSSIIHSFLFVPAELADNIATVLKSAFEITNGCSIVSNIPYDISYKLTLISFLIAFSGFSIIGQATGLLSSTNINKKIYYLSKVTHGIISAILCYLVFHFSLIKMPVPTAVINSASIQANYSIYLVELMLILILILNLSYRRISKIKYTRYYKKMIKHHKD